MVKCNRQEFKCPECGQMFKSSHDVKKHQNNEHEMEKVKSRVVCKHWRRGHCTKGKFCLYSHVGHPNNAGATNKNSTKVPSCKNGSTCQWLKKQSCSYFHPGVGVQKLWVNLDRKQGSPKEPRARSNHTNTQTKPQGQSNRATCKFDGRCDRIPNCPYIHYLEDFPLSRGEGTQ